MKRAVLLLLLALVPTMACATGQEGDIIYIDGQRWQLLGRPVGGDSVLYANVVASLPEERIESTANWDGFLGYWTLEGDMLILDSVTYEEDDPWRDVALSQAVMRNIFADYYVDGKIVAQWITGELRVAHGDVLLYEHGGWFRHYETEMFLELTQGRVSNRRLYHNCMVVDGLVLGNMSDSQMEDFRAGFLPTLRKYHELDTVNRVYFIVDNCKADSLGHILDIDVKVACNGHPDALPELAEEFKQFLISIHPWRTIRINGEYVAIWHGWSIPFKLNN